MIRFVSKTYTSSGNWTCPAGVSAVIVGGRGGSGGGAGYDNSWVDTGAGGCGTFTAYRIISVTPNTTYAIVVGSGGSAGAVDVSGSSGTSSTFGASATFVAGTGGQRLQNWINEVAAGPTLGHRPNFPILNVSFNGGMDSPFAAGGAGKGGGGGGDGIGALKVSSTLTAAVSGGGGAGGTSASTSGSNGTSGQIIVMWVE